MVQLTIGDSLPSIPVSVSGRIAVSVQDQPVDTIPFRIDQIQLAASHGPLDFELGFAGTAAARPLVPLDVVGVSFEDVNRFRDEEQVSDQQVSTIDSGSFGLAIGSRSSHILKKGEELRLPGFQGAVRDIASRLPGRGPHARGHRRFPPRIARHSPQRATGLLVESSPGLGRCRTRVPRAVRAGRALLEEGHTMRVVVGAIVLVTAAAAPLAAQRMSPMPVEAKNLVVQVLATGGDDEEVGAGIVVAASNRIIIATAAHVVRAAQQGGKVRVVFQFARNDTVEANVDQLDRDLDLAVLSLPRDAALHHPIRVQP